MSMRLRNSRSMSRKSNPLCPVPVAAGVGVTRIERARVPEHRCGEQLAQAVGFVAVRPTQTGEVSPHLLADQAGADLDRHCDQGVTAGPTVTEYRVEDRRRLRDVLERFRAECARSQLPGVTAWRSSSGCKKRKPSMPANVAAALSRIAGSLSIAVAAANDAAIVGTAENHRVTAAEVDRDRAFHVVHEIERPPVPAVMGEAGEEATVFEESF